MDERELLAAVHALARSDMELACGEEGHGSGHVCLAEAEDVGFPALLDEMSRHFGVPRNLATDGYVDPTLTERTGLPVVDPVREQIVELRAWSYGNAWVACGIVRVGDGTRSVALVAERHAVAPDELTPDASWVDRLVGITGWQEERVHVVDWPAIEAELGTALPADYKQLVERFGDGAFDGFLDLLLPDAPPGAIDLVEANKDFPSWAEPHGAYTWAPRGVHDAPVRLLWWAGCEQEIRFCWLPEDPDPDQWPVLFAEAGDSDADWERFDGSAAEFIYRMLTDLRHPHSTARYFDTHWFQTYQRPVRH
ncbi:SMI1/KNR4 family protein [Streptomyces sp. NPDC051940]|uniref:SMI1/KNR4 family protein n=1 Tax=Streptomyces sp. NPDC051940 TaxID=3155675 RepID=UPI003429F4ED